MKYLFCLLFVGCGCAENRILPDRVSFGLRKPLDKFLIEYGPESVQNMQGLEVVEWHDFPNLIGCNDNPKTPKVCVQVGECIWGNPDHRIIWIARGLVGLRLEHTVWHEACHCIMYQALDGHRKDPLNLMYPRVPDDRTLDENWNTIKKTCLDD